MRPDPYPSIDKAKLDLSAKLTAVSNVKMPVYHLRFDLALVNTGRRILNIVEAGIQVPVDVAKFRKQHPKFIPSGPAVMNLFKGESEGQFIQLEEGERQLIVIEPFDETTAHQLGETGIAFAKDTTGKIYKTSFYVGPAPDAVEKFRKSQEGKPD